jgi:hypothetical protein
VSTVHIVRDAAAALRTASQVAIDSIGTDQLGAGRLGRTFRVEDPATGEVPAAVPEHTVGNTARGIEIADAGACGGRALRP